MVSLGKNHIEKGNVKLNTFKMTWFRQSFLNKKYCYNRMKMKINTT